MDKALTLTALIEQTSPDVFMTRVAEMPEIHPFPSASLTEAKRLVRTRLLTLLPQTSSRRTIRLVTQVQLSAI